MLKVYKGNNASRQYENDFFRRFAKDLSIVFERRNLNGSLVGFPSTERDKTLRPDCLLITENRIVAIDFKHYNVKEVYLPDEEVFATKFWNTDKSSVMIAGSSAVNPFVQIQKQTQKLDKYLPSGGNVGGIAGIVLFHGGKTPPEIIGEVPNRFQSWFSIANERTILEVIDDVISVNASSKIDIEMCTRFFDAEEYRVADETIASLTLRLKISKNPDGKTNAAGWVFLGILGLGLVWLAVWVASKIL